MSTPSPSKPVPSTRPAISRSVAVKLVVSMTALLVLPLATYFVSRDRVFDGNTTYAAGAAAAVANIVMIGYIITAFFENDSDKNKRD